MVECPALRAASQFPQQPVSTCSTWQSACRPPEAGIEPVKRRSNWSFDLYAVRICTLGVLSRTPAAPHLQRHGCWIFLIHRRGDQRSCIRLIPRCRLRRPLAGPGFQNAIRCPWVSRSPLLARTPTDARRIWAISGRGCISPSGVASPS